MSCATECVDEVFFSEVYAVSSPTLQPAGPQDEAASGARKRQWRADASGRHSAFAWAIAAVAGAACISLAPSDNSIRLVLPLAIMVGFAWIAYPRSGSSGMKSSRAIQLADSTYFMGFLWTLWALIDAFVLKRKDVGPESAFLVFGYALVTTASGMALRLFMLQFRYDTEEVIEDAGATIEKNLERLTSSTGVLFERIENLGSATDALSAAVASAARSVGEADARLEELRKQSLQHFRELLTSTAADIRDAMRAPVAEYDQSLKAFTASVNENSTSFAAAVQHGAGAVTSSVEQAAHAARSILVDASRRIAAGHFEVVQELRVAALGLADEIRKVKEALARFDKLGPIIEQLAGVLVKLDQLSSEVVRQVGPESKVVEAFTKLRDDIHSTAQDVTTSLSNLSVKLANVEVPEKVVINLGAVTTALGMLEAQTRSLAVAISDPKWKAAPESATAAIQKLSATVAQLRDALALAEKEARDVRPARWLTRLWRR